MLTLEPVRLQGNYKNIVLSFSTLGLEKVQMWARKSCFSTLDCPDSEDCFWRAALVRVILAPSLTGSPVIVIIIILINIIIILINIIIIIIIVIIIGPNWVACDCDMLPTTYCSRTTLKAKYKFHTDADRESFLLRNSVSNKPKVRGHKKFEVA